ncbi:DUF2656 domain-containing protein [Scytonema tolypothrichoides VB-61278]|nr:DUF2656 domain-containing protein [Scytonema tolypothrichoides VB-61278]
MLLSHNFNVSDNSVPELSREQFANVFIEGFSDEKNIKCRLVDNPHWIVEILFPINEVSPQQIGDRCAQILAQKRRSQLSCEQRLPDILVLGGMKTSLAVNPAPESLQPGQWGVDVVETPSIEEFLQAIAWEATIAQKPADSIFKVELVQ